MKGHILVIEDNEQNLYLVRFILEKNGYTVSPPGTARRAAKWRIACGRT
jgi:CheY-like chemotaxis protein